MNLLKLLTLIATLGPKIPKALELLTALYNLFAEDIAKTFPSGGELQFTGLTAEESALVDKITAQLSASGTQAAFDLTRLRELVVWFGKSEVGKAIASLLVTLLTRAVI